MNNSVAIQFDWDELMGNISDQNLIPIIGNEVYKFIQDGRLQGLDEYLAAALLKENNLPADPLPSLPETITSIFKETNVHTRDVLRRLKEIIEAIDFTFPLLADFLEIDQMFFYLNTTVYTSILEKQFKETRKQDPAVINFSIRSKFQDCENIEELQSPLIFNVFGSFKSADPALIEEEMLEFTTTFHERMNDNAKTILDALKNKSLLFLGCSHPDWLTRFFLRVLSNERMNEWQNRNNQIVIINNQSNDRDKQYAFLKKYNAVTYEGNTDDFIRELKARWQKAHVKKVKPKMIFLSYTQKDVEAVEKLKQTISAINNVTCWYDKEKLFSGDNYEFTIIDNIRKADLFIPLISQNSLTQQDKYVLEEWSKADAVNKFRELDGKKERYLMPIVIDDADLNNNIIKKYYPQLSIEKVPGGNASEDFINRLKMNLNVT